MNNNNNSKLLAAVLLSGALFIATLVLALINCSFLLKVNQIVSKSANFFNSTASDFLLKMVTVIAVPWTTILFLILIVVAMIIRKKYHGAFFLFFVTAFTFVSEFFLKIFIKEPRPVDGVISLADYSFPSGHASISVAFFLGLAYVISARTDRLREKVFYYILSSTIFIVIGWSRLQLGVHWFHDIIGGYFLGLFWFFTGVLVLNMFRRLRPRSLESKLKIK